MDAWETVNLVVLLELSAVLKISAALKISVALIISAAPMAIAMINLITVPIQ